MTILESIKCILQQSNKGLTSKQIYEKIIHQGLYSFGAENPVHVVNAELRRRCVGLDFPQHTQSSFLKSLVTKEKR